MELSLYRIILFGDRIDRLKDFYIEYFKLELVTEIKGEWVVLKSGQIEIALHKIGSAYRTSGTFKTDSNTKLVFRVNRDLKALREMFLAKEVPVQEIISFPETNTLCFDGEDPEGNIFQLEATVA